MNRDERIRIFCSELWTWFDRHKRTLPWRDIKEKNLDHKAYRILVSEVMLQQTQVSRVIILYKNFIQKFPHIEDLAKATNREVLIAWRGLGYNNRALRLRDAARKIVTGRGGVFPREIDELQELPGVGHYTAGAIRNFAFGIPTPCIDVNIRRILHRFFIGPENADGSWKKDDRYLLKLAGEVLASAYPHPPAPSPDPFDKLRASERRGVRTTSDFHAALMDFGSLVCTKNSPKWELLSSDMKSVCKSYGKRIVRTKKVYSKEQGREVAGRHIPNRIFRGRIVEALRNHPKGLTLDAVGHIITPDWTMGDHREWMNKLIEGLERDQVIVVKNVKIMLRD
jgi:A/G-specific adenine glycosylase